MSSGATSKMPNAQPPKRPRRYGRYHSHYYASTSSFQTIWHSSGFNRVLSGKFLCDSLVTHRLNQALAVLIALSGRCDHVPELFYMAGMEVLKNIPSSHMSCVQFYKNMFLACPGHKKEILLNFALYLVQRQQDVTEGLELLKSKSNKVEFNEDLFHKAYIGLFECLCWRPQKDLGQSQLQQDIDILLSDEDEQFGEKAAGTNTDYVANHAMNLFEDVFLQPGVWDVFVPAYLHLLEHCKGVNHARKFLEKYRNINKLNPNAHRYLYHFLKLNADSSSELIRVLEDLIELDPTSELLGELVHLKMESGDMESVIELIFQKLDHAACMWDEETWKMFEEFLLVNSEDNVDMKNEVHLGWKERESWWPQYHFRFPYNFTIAGKRNVMLAKANVAEHFLGENDFSKKVRLSCGKDQMIMSNTRGSDSDTKRTTRKRQLRDTSCVNETQIIKKPRQYP